MVSGWRAATTAAICLLLMAGLGLWQHGMETLASVVVATAVTLLIGSGWDPLGPQPALLVGAPASPRPRPDDAVVRLPAAGRRVVRGEPSHRDRGRDHLRHPAGRPARRGRHPRRLDDDHRGRESSGAALSCSGRSSCRSPAGPPARGEPGIVLVRRWSSSAALVGAGALGCDVIAGFAQTEDFGKGLAAGISIVLLGIVLDRITQGAGTRRQAVLDEETNDDQAHAGVLPGELIVHSA
jgi:glycine betaine/proline transport system permease protein